MRTEQKRLKRCGKLLVKQSLQDQRDLGCTQHRPCGGDMSLGATRRNAFCWTQTTASIKTCTQISLADHR